MRAIGLNPIAQSDVAFTDPSGAFGTVVPQATIAARALLMCGVNPNMTTTFVPGTAPTVAVSDIATRVLTKLGVIDPTETPNSADLAEATIAVSEVTQTLTYLQICNWGTAIPQWAEAGMVQMAMALAGSSFGRPEQADMYEAGLMMLWRISLSGINGQARAMDALLSVHSRLQGLGYVFWPATAIPQFAVDSYVPMVAAELMQSFAGEFAVVSDTTTTTNSETSTTASAANRIQIIGAANTAAAAAMETLRRIVLSSPTLGIANVTDKLGAVQDALNVLGFVTWTYNTIPVAYSEDYVTMGTALMAPVMDPTRSAADRQVDKVMYDAAVEHVRKGVYSSSYGVALATEKLQSVHDALNADGLVSWPFTAVPAAQAEDYVEMGKALMAPDVDPSRDQPSRAADSAAWDAARNRIARAAQVAGAQSLLQDRVGTVHGELSATNLVSWSLAAVPDGVADAYVQMAANAAQPSFGGKFDPGAYDMARKRVREFAMSGPPGQALAEQKVRAVHADLDARGKVLWSLFDLPDYAEEPYVLMAAELLAPEVDVQLKAPYGQMGEMMLARTRSLSSQGHSVRAEYF